MPNSNNAARTLNALLSLVERNASLQHRLTIAENSLKAKQELIDDQHKEIKHLRGWSDTRAALSPVNSESAFHVNRRNRAR